MVSIGSPSVNFDLLEIATESSDHLEIALGDVSPRDSVWDVHRTETTIITAIYDFNAEFERYSSRMRSCSGWLRFGATDERLVLKQAFFCHLRYCPVCQWRKSLYWKAMMYQTYDELKRQYPSHRFIFLTLTIKNPLITDLRDTLGDMNRAWHRLVKRKEFLRVVDGWIRTTEVTRPNNTHAHPHFHAILMVKPSYFTQSYINHAQWVEMWRTCLRVDYAPVVDVRRVKASKKAGYDTDQAVKAGIMETLKYAVKPSEVIQGFDDLGTQAWFYELTRQTHKLRFIATGGALKGALKSDCEITNSDLVKADDVEIETDQRRYNFTYYPSKGRYVYTLK